MRVTIDKLAHFFAGWAIDATLAPYAGYMALGVTGAIGAGKELVYDKALGKGSLDLGDFLAMLAGGVCSQVTRFAILYFIKA